MLPRGQRISHYRLLRRLKVGGMGEIYLALDELLDRQVAIKIITIDYAQYGDPEEAAAAERQFLREARAIGRFNHGHILHIYEANKGMAHDMPVMYMVMPYCPEGSLADWLERHNVSLPLSLQAVERIVAQAAEALQLAHDHEIIHLDVKPGNFLVQQPTAHPARLKLQLADFGIARLLKSGNESQSIRGTPYYMAPEQWQGRSLPATDQYSLAVMTYELLTGQRPFRGSNPEQIWFQHEHVVPDPPGALNSFLPGMLDAVILRALEKAPEQRFDSVSHFSLAFERASHGNDAIISFPASYPVREDRAALAELSTLPPTFQPPSRQQRAAPQAQQHTGVTHRVFVPFLLVLLVIAASAGLFFYLHSLAPDKPPPVTQGVRSPDGPSTLAQQESATAQAQQQTRVAQVGATSAVGTVSADQTATAHAIATSVAATHAAATSTANADATATIVAFYNSLGVHGSPDISDSLQNNKQGDNWEMLNLQGGSCGFTQNMYYVTGDANTYATCFEQNNSLQNFAAEINVTVDKGYTGGFIFCGSEQAGNFYAFTITTHGEYSLVKYQNYAPTVLVQQSSSAIRTGLGQKNTLAVRVANGTITMFINMQRLPPITDSSYSSGNFGAIAASETATTTVTFSNLEIWKLS